MMWTSASIAKRQRAAIRCTSAEMLAAHFISCGRFAHAHVPASRDTCHATEGAREMALVEEPERYCYLGNPPIALGEHCLRALDAQAHRISHQALTRAFTEQPGEMKTADADRPGEFVKREILPQIVFHIAAGEHRGAPAQASSRGPRVLAMIFRR